MNSRICVRMLRHAEIVMCLSTVSLFGQLTTETVNVRDSRPLSALGLEVQARTGVPINYEDPRYENAADLEDVTDRIMSAEQKAQAQPGVRIVVPKGGTLAASVSFDQKRAKPDLLSATSAMNAAILAQNDAGVLSPKFEMSTVGNSLFVRPLQVRDASGQMRRVSPVLDTRVTVPRGTRSVIATLEVLLKQVSATSGYTIHLGTMPIRTMMTTQVTVGADQEAASAVLARMLADISNISAGLASNPRFSYVMYFDAKQRSYAFNVQKIPDSFTEGSSRTDLPLSQPSSAEGVYFKKSPGF